MENTTETPEEKEKKEQEERERKIRQKWHHAAGYAILVCKILVVLFVLAIVSLITWEYVTFGYSGLLIGLELSLGFIIVFRLVRYHTHVKDLPKNDYKTKPDRDDLKLLLQDLEWDIEKYERSSSYYFGRVKALKHWVIFLAGISTIILGLDLDRISVPFWNLEFEYKIFSKNTALVIGAIVTALTTYMAFWNLEKYWVINKNIVNELRAVRDRANRICATSERDETEIKELFTDYYAAKEKFLKYWEGALGDRGGQSGN